LQKSGELGKLPALSAVHFIPLLRRGSRPEGADGVVGHPPAHAKTTTPAASPPPLLRRGICRGPFPSLGGVSGPKGLTGWSSGRLQKSGELGKLPALSAVHFIPLLRRGGRPEGADGVVLWTFAEK